MSAKKTHAAHTDETPKARPKKKRRAPPAKKLARAETPAPSTVAGCNGYIMIPVELIPERYRGAVLLGNELGAQLADALAPILAKLRSSRG